MMGAVRDRDEDGEVKGGMGLIGDWFCRSRPTRIEVSRSLANTLDLLLDSVASVCRRVFVARL